MITSNKTFIVCVPKGGLFLRLCADDVQIGQTALMFFVTENKSTSEVGDEPSNKNAKDLSEKLEILRGRVGETKETTRLVASFPVTDTIFYEEHSASGISEDELKKILYPDPIDSSNTH